MNRDDAAKAVDDAFADGVKHLYDIFVEGIEIGTPLTTLAERFRKGLAFHRCAHSETAAVVEDYFKGLKP